VTDAYPNASSYTDHNGHVRWRYRRAGKQRSLPHAPGHPEFEAAYKAAVEGRIYKPQRVVKFPGTVPRSMRAAWRIVTTRTQEWHRLRESSKDQQRNVADRFFDRIVPDTDPPLEYGDVLVEHLKRRHIKRALADMADTPHAARHVLSLIRKLITVALDEEWIEVDPTHRLTYRPEFGGWRAWTMEERRLFEKRWPVGTTPRLAYALALYLGHRKADVALAKWAAITPGWAGVTQQKTGRYLDIPILPPLAEVLAATPRASDYILLNAYGRPFSIKALGMRMQDWTRQAGIGPGATMHGLRKTLGKMLAEAGASTRQLMDILGHTDIAHAELYTREAEQKVLASDGMRRLAKPRLVGGDE
jgi:integrase